MVRHGYTGLHKLMNLVCTGCKRTFSMSSAVRQHPQEDVHSPATSRLTRYTVAVEGNIACGKSTMLGFFKSNYPTCQTMQEPVNRWTNVDGHNALKLLYKDPSRWSFAFNNFAMLSRLEMHSAEHVAPVKMIERSLYSTRHVFVQNSCNHGFMTGLEQSVLDVWFDHLFPLPLVHLDLIVYLRTSPEICHERMRKRGRPEENPVSLSFLTDLHNLYDDWLIHHKYPLPSPVLVLDATADLETMYRTYRDHSDAITCGCS